MEFIGTDRHDRILATLVLAQMGTQAGEQDVDAEWLRDVVVWPTSRPRIVSASLLAGGTTTGRRTPWRRIKEFATVRDVMEADVQEDRVIMRDLGLLETFPPPSATWIVVKLL